MSSGPSSLTSIFMKAVKWGAMLFIGALLTEPIIFALFHGNLGGMSLMSALSPYFNGFFDTFGITDGLHWVSDQITGGPTQLAADIGGTLAPAPGGGEMIVPDLGDMDETPLPNLQKEKLRSWLNPFNNFGFGTQPAMSIG